MNEQLAVYGLHSYQDDDATIWPNGRFFCVVNYVYHLVFTTLYMSLLSLKYLVRDFWLGSQTDQHGDVCMLLYKMHHSSKQVRRQATMIPAHPHHWSSNHELDVKHV